jgi:hypothetical protein
MHTCMHRDFKQFIMIHLKMSMLNVERSICRLCDKGKINRLGYKGLATICRLFDGVLLDAASI